ncbi:MAG: response regulator transcription factor [Oscillospiraceae bacterium]|nr:response regulator transcription factor [Oscillospiraceae bacterium]
MAKILIVEDDLNISKLIKDTLELGNYEADCAFDGIEGIEKIKQTKYDLILLDIMLPGIDGLEMMQKITNINCPVIYLSAKNDVNTIVKGLKLGAEDYMTKPFEPLELLARVELRMRNKNQEVYKYKDIEVNILERVVYKNKEKIDLAPKEFDLFVLLVSNVGIALTRDEILDKVWDIMQDVETRTVDYHIQQLRKKLDLKEEISTIQRVGYRLEKVNEV